MSAATITDIRARILAITATYSGIGTDISTGELNAVQFPAYTCIAGQSTWRKLSANRYLVDRTYELWVYVTLITDVNNETLIREAISDCDAWIAGLAVFFSNRPRLDLVGASPVELVHDVQDIGDSGPAQTPLRGKTYSGFRLLIPTTVSAP